MIKNEYGFAIKKVIGLIILIAGIVMIWMVLSGKVSNGEGISFLDITGESKAIVYPEGKTRKTVEVGDIITIGSEEFYLVKHDGNNLVLLSHYNLKVGYDSKILVWDVQKVYRSDEEGYGIQSSETKGFIFGESVCKGVVQYTTLDTYDYWKDKIGTKYPGIICDKNTWTEDATCAYIYDRNSNLYEYVEEYKKYLEKQGARIKNARLLKIEEAYELGCNIKEEKCVDANPFLFETTYWLGSAEDTGSIWRILSNGNLGGGDDIFSTGQGVRPVIVI